MMFVGWGGWWRLGLLIKCLVFFLFSVHLRLMFKPLNLFLYLNSLQLLAVKKLEPAVSRQLSDDGFLNLVSSISKLKHASIVKIVGYCAEYGERLLVHEYCRNGTLNDALHLEDVIHGKLSWYARIRIALGAAKALE